MSFTKNKSIILYFLLIILILLGINISDIINEQKAKNDLLEQRIKTASERLFDFATFRSVETAITKLIDNPTEINKEEVNSYIKYVDTIVQSYILLNIDKDTLKKEFNINNIKDVSLSSSFLMESDLNTETEQRMVRDWVTIIIQFEKDFYAHQEEPLIFAQAYINACNKINEIKR